MKQRKWTSKQKLKIVLEGMAGRVPLAELCLKHQINQSQYYTWRDRLLSDGEKVSREFQRPGVSIPAQMNIVHASNATKTQGN